MNVMTPMPTEEQLVEKMITLIQNAYLDAINGSNYIFEILEVPSATRHCIEVQYCYDKDYNRFFIEFEVSESVKRELPWERIVAKVHNYINTNFYKDTQVYPEIITYDDDVNERYDSITQLSPYTIGYWDCLHGHYEYLYSHQVFMDHMSGLNIPTWSEEFLKEMDENFAANYLSDYQTFLNNMVAIRNKHKISGDQPPEKKIEDFAAIVKSIRDKYEYKLSNEDKETYIQEFMSCKGDPEKVKELNSKYGIGKPNWSKIPEIMAEYKVAYKDFFGVELHDFISNTKRLYIIQA